MLVICHSSKPTEPNIYQENLHSLLPCKVIYSKEYQHGTLFALFLQKKTLVGTIDDELTVVDQCMQSNSGVFSTKFTSISNMLSGKIKTFSKKEYKFDEHYRALFSIDGHSGRQDTPVLPDVKAWYPHGNGPNGFQAIIDSIVEDESSETDTPGPAQTQSSGKELATTQKKRKLENTNLATDETVTPVEQVHALRLELEELKQEIEELRTEMDKYADQVTDLSTELADYY